MYFMTTQKLYSIYFSRTTSQSRWIWNFSKIPHKINTIFQRHHEKETAHSKTIMYKLTHILKIQSKHEDRTENVKAKIVSKPSWPLPAQFIWLTVSWRWERGEGRLIICPRIYLTDYFKTAKQSKMPPLLLLPPKKLCQQRRN